MYSWPYQLKKNKNKIHTHKKIALLIFVDRDREKGIFQINMWIPRTRECVNLLKQWNYIWFSSCNWSQPLVKFTIIHYHFPRSFCPLHRPNRLAAWECGGNHHFGSFPSLVVALISSVPLALSLHWDIFPPLKCTHIWKQITDYIKKSNDQCFLLYDIEYCCFHFSCLAGAISPVKGSKVRNKNVVIRKQ